MALLAALLADIAQNTMRPTVKRERERESERERERAILRAREGGQGIEGEERGGASESDRQTLCPRDRTQEELRRREIQRRKLDGEDTNREREICAHAGSPGLIPQLVMGWLR